MAYELAHNGTRPGGMSRAGHRNASERHHVKNDIQAAYLKRASMRMARYAARAAVRAEVARYVYNEDVPGAHWLICEACRAYREYDRWMEYAQWRDKANLPIPAARRPVLPCVWHDYELWAEATWDD